jgi:hypothetical protein
MNLKHEGWQGIDWIHLAQDKFQWWTRVNQVMDIRVPQMLGIS